ncbi:MAG: pyruvate carboxylase subunit B [Bacillota bacterium]
MTHNSKVGITDTTLRDAHQSLMATRLRNEHIMPIISHIDEVGYHSLEVWGGATFDTCLRFLDEDPWERLVQMRELAPRSPFQMLLRGQNLVGYRHYPDDVVDAFVRLAVKNGINIIRIFDALNDTRNMSRAMAAARAAGAHVQATLSYTLSPLHNIEYFVQLAVELEKMGADSIAIKDMAGLLTPYATYTLVQRLKESIELPVQLHSHFTSGMAFMAYLKGIEAGCDVVDTAISALSLGSSQPATESMVAALQGTPYDTGLDLEQISHIADYFKEVRKHYDIPADIVMGVDTAVLSYQIPGGMISNLASQLASQNATNLLPQVLEEVPRVRAELGYPPLVTPSSQIVGTQAVINVISGERYKVILTEVKNYLRGLYGRPPGEVDPDLLARVIGKEAPYQGRPADLLEPGLEKGREELGKYMEKEEDILSYILFPQQALSFFQRRRGEIPPQQNAAAPAVKTGTAASHSGPAAVVQLDKLYTVDHDLLASGDETDCFIYPSA